MLLLVNDEELIQKLLKDRAFLKERLNAIESALHALGYNEKTAKDIEIPNRFKDTRSIRQKVLFILRESEKPLSAADVRNRIIQEEDNINEEDVQNSKDPDRYPNLITVMLSAMYKSNEIKAQKQGKKNLYYLNEQ